MEYDLHQWTTSLIWQKMEFSHFPILILMKSEKNSLLVLDIFSVFACRRQSQLNGNEWWRMLQERDLCVDWLSGPAPIPFRETSWVVCTSWIHWCEIWKALVRQRQFSCPLLVVWIFLCRVHLCSGFWVTGGRFGFGSGISFLVLWWQLLECILELAALVASEEGTSPWG